MSFANIRDALDFLEREVPYPPPENMPMELFLYLSRMMPMVNVDLLIKDNDRQVLLLWRDDEYYGEGWHVPGRIIRYKETIAECIEACAMNEFGAIVKHGGTPLAVNETIYYPSRRDRAHFISLLYECSLVKSPNEKLRFDGDHYIQGVWAWHEGCPSNLIEAQRFYRGYLE